MNISKVLTFLVAGIVIGAILFFAGFGLLNLLKNDEPDAEVVVNTALVPQVTVAAEAVPINPPEIKITSSQSVDAQGTSKSPIKIKPLRDVDVGTNGSAEPEIQTVAFGTLTLITVNSINNDSTNADFLIENSNNVAIALVKDTSSSTLSLPVGDYKITVSQAGQKVVRFLGVKDGQNGSEVFELDVPILTGEAPTETVGGGYKAVVATSIPAETTSVTSTDVPQEVPVVDTAAIDPATATTVESTEAPTESAEVSDETSEVATPETSTVATDTPATPTVATDTTEAPKSAATGGLRLSALTKQGKRPLDVSFYIQHPDGKNVKNFRNVKTQQLILPAGKYQVTAKTSKTTLVKQVEVLATRGIHEIFLIPDQTAAPDKSATSTASQAEESNTDTTTAAKTPEENKAPGKLELFAQKAVDNSPLKSNFYVQMPNGELVVSKVYVDSIGYKLPAGKYKVVVRATGYKNKSITLNVRAGQTRREVFKFEAINTSSAIPASTPTTTAITSSAQTTQGSNIAYGGLTVSIVSSANNAEIPADIVITQTDGTPLKRARGVASASFDLPPRDFIIKVTLDGQTTNHPVKIKAGQLAIKTISLDTQTRSRRERRRLRRERAQ